MTRGAYSPEIRKRMITAFSYPYHMVYLCCLSTTCTQVPIPSQHLLAYPLPSWWVALAAWCPSCPCFLGVGWAGCQVRAAWVGAGLGSPHSVNLRRLKPIGCGGVEVAVGMFDVEVVGYPDLGDGVRGEATFAVPAGAGPGVHAIGVRAGDCGSEAVARVTHSSSPSFFGEPGATVIVVELASLVVVSATLVVVVFGPLVVVPSTVVIVVGTVVALELAVVVRGGRGGRLCPTIRAAATLPLPRRNDLRPISGLVTGRGVPGRTLLVVLCGLGRGSGRAWGGLTRRRRERR